VGDATHDHVHFIQMPPGTPTGFPVAQALTEFTTEIDAPDADRLARYLNAPLEE